MFLELKPPHRYRQKKGLYALLNNRGNHIKTVIAKNYLKHREIYPNLYHKTSVKFTVLEITRKQGGTFFITAKKLSVCFNVFSVGNILVVLHIKIGVSLSTWESLRVG